MTAPPVKSKILVIEDQPEVLATMIHLLNRVGCEAVGANNGSEGMRLAQESKFDLITLDIDFPDTNGLELCRRLKSNLHLCRIPVVFVSGRTGEGNRKECLELGAADTSPSLLTP